MLTFIQSSCGTAWNEKNKKEIDTYLTDIEETKKEFIDYNKIITNLTNVTVNNNIAQKIIDESMANNWAGIFNLKINLNFI